MTHKTQSISISLLLFISSLFGILVFFVSMVYFKMNPSINVHEQKLQDSIVDSALIIRQKDSTFNALQKKFDKLKQDFENKHDTVIVYKTIYKVQSDTTK